jgi:hypothetical protein
VLLANGRVIQVLAAGHHDKKPMHLVATCGTMLPAPIVQRLRSYMNDSGCVQRKKYLMEQPMVFWIYRRFFNAVDRADRIALGPRSVIAAWRTKQVLHRLFAAVFAMTEANGYHALRACHPGSGAVSREWWRRWLAIGLIKPAERLRRMPAADDDPMAKHMELVLMQKQLRCKVCGSLTKYSCSCCLPGMHAVCASGSTGRGCHMVHVKAELQKGGVEEGVPNRRCTA